MAQHRFTKMHGCGNDFVVFDTFSGPLDLSLEQIRQIADRRRGIGCDQVLLLGPARDDQADVRYRIFNADGGEVMQCGNGARCAALYLREKGLLSKARIIAETGAGVLILTVGEDKNVRVNMGRPDFDPARIPLAHGPEAERYRLRIQAALSKSLLPGLEDAVVSSRIMTPIDFRDRLSSENGAAFGLEPVFTQSAWFRPHNRSEEVDSLYLVGAGTHPGAGVPGVLSSARILDEVVPHASSIV